MRERAQRLDRIPASLKAVFLASNRGMEVKKPPPERVAFKVFFRNWRFQSNSASGVNGLPVQKKGATSSPMAVSEQKKPVESMPKRDFEKSAKYQPLLKPRKEEMPSTPALALSPQAYLDAMIRSRGYCTSRFKSLQTAYYNKPTQLQQSSYDIRLIELVRQNDIEAFREIISSGISPNPCNQYGESTLHMVCRKGHTAFLSAMLEAGASVQVSDDYGRTPLHDACWAAKPCFDVVKLILLKDSRLFHMTDCRGAVPLSYVPKKDWAEWLQFLDSIKDEFWPKRDVMRDGAEEPPELALLGANTRPLAGPPKPLTVELAAMAASGKMTPNEAHFLVHDITECETSGEPEWDDDDSSSCDDDSESGDDSDFSLDEDEMADILNTLTLPTN